MSSGSRWNPALRRDTATTAGPVGPLRRLDRSHSASRIGKPVGSAALQMVDLALPLGYHDRFRRLASVKLMVPTGLMKRGLPSSNLRNGFETSTTTRHVVLPNPRRRFQGRASTRLTLSRRFGRTKREED
jgi:hypothetical protein